MFATGGLHIDQAPPLGIPFRFFVTAPLFMVAAAFSCFYNGSDLFISPLVPQTIATVHLLVLGWISMVMFGALYQMIPVLAGVPVPWIRLAPWVHAMLILGVFSLYLGLATELHPWMLLLASAGLGSAILLFFVPVFVALSRTSSKHPALLGMRMAAVSLLGVLLLGGIFLGEWAHGFLDLDRQVMVTIHLTWGLFGWVGSLIIGVSFQVLPMFYMTKELNENHASMVLAGWGASLLALPLTLFFFPTNIFALILSVVPGVIALLFFGQRMAVALMGRKRKKMDVSLRLWILGSISGACSLFFFPLWFFLDQDWPRFLFGGLFILGFASAIILAMLYKIIPFLVWFHRFSRFAGLVEIPMMDDLVPDNAARWQFPAHLLVLVCLLGTVLASGHEITVYFLGVALIIDASILLYALLYALKQKPKDVPEIPDFSSFFKDGSPLSTNPGP